MTQDMQEAQRLILGAASASRDVRTADLLHKVETKSPKLSADTVRSAYWNLVSDGRLHRTGSGVRKVAR